MKNLFLLLGGLASIGVMYAALLAIPKPVRAQAGGGALVVSICGTLPQAYVAGSTRTWTVNTNGQVCQ